MSTSRYFAYGSNLNAEDFQAWCRNGNHPAIVLRNPARAVLPDHELAFTYYSTSRKGGVLDVRFRAGHFVSGVLFDISEAGLRVIDLKEGAPNAYERKLVTVLDGVGNKVAAVTYRVRPDRAVEFVRPTEDYLRIVANGLRDFGLYDGDLQAAATQRDNEPASNSPGTTRCGQVVVQGTK